MLQLLMMLMLSTNPDINKQEKYKYFPEHWPMHEEIKKIDSLLIGHWFELMGEKPLNESKGHNSYRISNWIGTLYVEQDNNDVCEIRFHRLNKDAILNESLPRITTFRINGIKNCSKEANIKTIKELVWGVEISLPVNILKGGYFIPDSFCTVEAYRSGEDSIYQLKITWTEKDIKIIVDYYKKISKLFKKHGININADFSPY